MFKWFARLILPTVWDLGAVWSWTAAAIPTAVAGVAGMIGVYDSLSLMWAVAGTTFTAASTIVIVVGYKILRFQGNPEHKLKFVGPHVSNDKLTIRLGFEIRNDALFPIEINLSDLRTSCASTINPNNKKNFRKFEIAPGETIVQHEAAIDITRNADTVMHGRMDMSINYGHPGKIRYVIIKDIDFLIPRDPLLPFRSMNHVEVDHV